MHKADLLRCGIGMASLAAGTAVYVCCRQDAVAVQRLFATEWLDAVRIEPPDDSTIAGYVLLYCLPDALWYLALLLMQTAICRAGSAWGKSIVWFSVLLPFAWEAMQLTGMIGGWFDAMDIVFYVLVLIVLWINDKKFCCLLGKWQSLRHL